jgi:tRNA U34 5-methylaminomethyl-2-thiouridine-forming methyltransferase MnmC
MDPELIITSDGSHSLRVPVLNETYHSTHGALRESLHVFVKAGFDHVASSTVCVLEVGLGTGLNALLTVKAAVEAGRQVAYYGIEAFPLSQNLTAQLNYAALLDHPQSKEWFRCIHDAAWGSVSAIAEGITLTKIHGAIQDTEWPGNFFDLVYFDAFAPQKQPEMWTPDVFAKVHGAMKSGGILVTYCAKGQVKRDLRSVGFSVESLPGPPGKREMIRATRLKS